VGKLVAVARAHWFQLPAGPGHTFEVDLVLAARHLGARFALFGVVNSFIEPGRGRAAFGAPIIDPRHLVAPGAARKSLFDCEIEA